jgi:hypothetical protein
MQDTSRTYSTFAPAVQLAAPKALVQRVAQNAPQHFFWGKTLTFDWQVVLAAEGLSADAKQSNIQPIKRRHA